MKQSITHTATQQPFPAPFSIGHDDDLASVVVVGIIDVQPQRLVDVIFNKLVKVALASQRSTGPADDKVSVWNQPGGLSGRPFEDLENVPHVGERMGWIAESKREAQ